MDDNSKLNVVMVAGEASGDLLGGELIKQLQQRLPNVAISGVGGPQMRTGGLSGPYDVNDLSVIGLVEVLKRLPRLIRVFTYLTKLLKQKKPKLLVTIDLPDFNFLLARRAKALGIPIVHYVSPQVWAWRSGRVNKIAELVDHLLVLFPFEQELYSQTKLPVTFVGHPLVDKLQPWILGRQDSLKRQEVRSRLGIMDGEKMVVLLPGSRHSEVKRLLATMLAACANLSKNGNRVRYLLAQADTLSAATMADLWPKNITGDHGELLKNAVMVRQGETYDLLMAADATLVASGTATLETALIGTPMVVMYKVNRLTYEIGKRVIQVPFIALANLVAGRQLVTERIQEAANPVQLADDLHQLLHNKQIVANMQDGYREIREKLSQPNTYPVDVIAGYLI